MDAYQQIIATIALMMGTAWASGINLYATIAILGILGSTGNVVLPQQLVILQDPLIIGAASIMYCVEFFADKTPGSRHRLGCPAFVYQDPGRGHARGRGSRRGNSGPGHSGRHPRRHRFRHQPCDQSRLQGIDQYLSRAILQLGGFFFRGPGGDRRALVGPALPLAVPGPLSPLHRPGNLAHPPDLGGYPDGLEKTVESVQTG